MRVAIAGGGTGGHLFPGLALAERLRGSPQAAEVVFFGSRRGIESQLVEPAGFELVAHELEGLRGRSPLAAVQALAKLAVATAAVRRELRRRRMDVVVGLGGYASAAGVIGAVLARVPVVILEQNRRPGLANRAMGRLAAAVCTSFDDSSRYFPASRCRFTGNPLRSALEAVGEEHARDTLLVFGGSAGAHSLNKAVVGAFGELCDSIELPPIVHQAGAVDVAEVTQAYRDYGIRADVRPFIDDMAAVYGRARLAVCRAGATSIAELVATATPAVFLPFPTAAGDHQRDNAMAMVAAGAAELVDDDENAVACLAKVLKRLLLSTERLDSMAERARAMVRRGATDRVLEVIEDVSGFRKRHPN